jgi:HlyD family secretion protein
LELEVQVAQVERTEIFPGQTALLTSTAFPGKEWTAEVARIVPVKKASKNDDTVTVLLNLGESAPPVSIGQPIEAQIRVPTQTTVLQVPPDAVAKSRTGEDTAALVTNGMVHFVPVVTGEVTPNYVEIRQGLSEGQTVLPLAKMSEWPAEGAHVKVMESTDEL